jgi:hypothetical protein
MRRRWFILAAVLLLGFGLFLLLPYIVSPYIRFMDKSPSYYMQVADAFELVRQQHPLGTNEFIEISVSDPSIPKIIQDLHPGRIRCFRDGAGAIIGVGRLAYSVAWYRDDMGTNFNAWILETNAEGLRKTVYSRTRL